jgi:tRNA 2-thiouridine synthesizing protein E
MSTHFQLHELKDISWSADEMWSLSLAKKNAGLLGITWDQTIEPLVLTTRAFFQEFDHSPNTRVLVKYVKTKIDPAISSLSLQIMLKGNPALVLAYLSGIPKPKQCF